MWLLLADYSDVRLVKATAVIGSLDLLAEMTREKHNVRKAAASCLLKHHIEKTKAKDNLQERFRCVAREGA